MIFYECFGQIRPPEIEILRVFTRIRGTCCSNPTCFTVLFAVRSGAEVGEPRVFTRIRGTGCPNPTCFTVVSAVRVGARPGGVPGGGQEVPSGRMAETHGKTRRFCVPGGGLYVKNAYERCTPHESLGPTVLPTASGVFPPGSRDAIPRGLRRFWPSLAGSVAGSAHESVGAKFRPTALGGVRAARVPFRGSILLHSYVFYRPTRCGSGAQT